MWWVSGRPCDPIDPSDLLQWCTEAGDLGGSNPLPEILKALQNHAKINPIVKTVKNC